MLVPIYTIKLSQKILPRRISLGKFDGVHPNIVGATAAGKVFVHNPFQSITSKGGRLITDSGNTMPELSYLNFGQQISAVHAGCITDDKKDTLFVGSQTHFLAYDVFNNADLFYNETPDGVSTIIHGYVADLDIPLVFTGGNCSITGWGKTGNDDFWTVTGDNVQSLALLDYDQDGYNELIVGSEDYEIRIFHGDEMIAEITETESVTNIVPINDTKFGYSLANGTVGIYDRMSRYWRIKSKNQAVSIFAFDINDDGVQELITGWSSGKIDARTERTGEVVQKDNFNAPIAGLVAGDYRKEGRDQLISCSVEGEIRGYSSIVKETKPETTTAEQNTLRELNQRKNNLLMELKNYSENIKAGKDVVNVSQNAARDVDGQQLGIIPANTQLQTSLAVATETDSLPSHVVLYIGTTNDTVIKAVMIFAEGIFNGESHVIHPPPNMISNNVSVPIFPPKDVPVDLHVKTFVGHKNSTQFHVFELSRQLPRFSLYVPAPASMKKPTSNVSCPINERVNRLVMWANQNFLLEEEVVGDEKLSMKLVALRSGVPLFINMEPGNLSINCDDIDLAGDLVQAITTSFNIDDLNSTAHYPQFIAFFKEVLQKVNDYNIVRAKLSAEMADNSNLIRSLIIRGEDCRLMGDMQGMKQAYRKLYSVNRDLIDEYNIRCNNHKELMNCLKIVNQGITRAARLRCGRPKTEFISACRQALKENDIEKLFKLIERGVQ